MRLFLFFKLDSLNTPSWAELNSKLLRRKQSTRHQTEMSAFIWNTKISTTAKLKSRSIKEKKKRQRIKTRVKVGSIEH